MRERQAYNMEVQILSGIAKYIGFPAAPEVKGAASSEMQQDLEAMGVSRFFFNCLCSLMRCSVTLC